MFCIRSPRQRECIALALNLCCHCNHKLMWPQLYALCFQMTQIYSENFQNAFINASYSISDVVFCCSCCNSYTKQWTVSIIAEPLQMSTIVPRPQQISNVLSLFTEKSHETWQMLFFSNERFCFKHCYTLCCTEAVFPWVSPLHAEPDRVLRTIQSLIN